MRIIVEISVEEFEDSGFETLVQLEESIYRGLDETGEYPGYNVYINLTQDDSYSK